MSKNSDPHWIEHAHLKPGALHNKLGVPEGKRIPNGVLKKAEHSKSPKLAKEANTAATLRAMHRKYGGSCA